MCASSRLSGLEVRRRRGATCPQPGRRRTARRRRGWDGARSGRRVGRTRRRKGRGDAARNVRPHSPAGAQRAEAALPTPGRPSCRSLRSRSARACERGGQRSRPQSWEETLPHRGGSDCRGAAPDVGCTWPAHPPRAGCALPPAQRAGPSGLADYGARQGLKSVLPSGRGLPVVGGASWLRSHLGCGAAWRVLFSEEEPRPAQAPPAASVLGRLALRWHSFAQASILREQVTEAALEDLGGDGEGRKELQGHIDKGGKSGWRFMKAPLG